jgi:hypothetical protein
MDLIGVNAINQKAASARLAHEPILVNDFTTYSVRPEHGRRTPNGFSKPVKAQSGRDGLFP